MTKKEAKKKIFDQWQEFLQNNIDYAGISEAYQMAIKALGQKLLVIEYNGTEHRIECESFEFRTNQVTNWIRVKKFDDSIEMIHDVCVVKAESEE